MKHLILSGCAGRMGRMLESLIEQRDDCRIAAGVDPAPYHSEEFPVYSNWERCPPNADGILDFSGPGGPFSHAGVRHRPWNSCGVRHHRPLPFSGGGGRLSIENHPHFRRPTSPSPWH